MDYGFVRGPLPAKPPKTSTPPAKKAATDSLVAPNVSPSPPESSPLIFTVDNCTCYLLVVNE